MLWPQWPCDQWFGNWPSWCIAGHQCFLSSGRVVCDELQPWRCGRAGWGATGARTTPGWSWWASSTRNDATTTQAPRPPTGHLASKSTKYFAGLIASTALFNGDSSWGGAVMSLYFSILQFHYWCLNFGGCAGVGKIIKYKLK